MYLLQRALWGAFSNKKSENSEDGVLTVRDSEHEGFSTLWDDDDAVLPIWDIAKSLLKVGAS
ncbi:hypothetical protein HYDPIDRAFT_34973 [Hydnomerulius pinastri MD-312]|uniref:Uncharacterized protein n=1 Tax=Hydnomerulius pinastri MD-312 TaxID=994086 RepID=A0A0C2PR88_9AGAM|nr:hypothetical protein HYDPIDRAFT_34975 [Hydnomerulius pinastri MD-312]KIJ57575.1 hypothetical protein HYDPIDRAFT_34973 [Hydnomerulius pinastri MD-312]